MSSTSELKSEDFARPRSKMRTKSFVENIDNDKYLKNCDSKSKQRATVHARHRSDG